MIHHLYMVSQLTVSHQQNTSSSSGAGTERYQPQEGDLAYNAQCHSCLQELLKGYPVVRIPAIQVLHHDSFSTVIAGVETPQDAEQIRSLLRIDNRGGRGCRGLHGHYAPTQLPTINGVLLSLITIS